MLGVLKSNKCDEIKTVISHYKHQLISEHRSCDAQGFHADDIRVIDPRIEPEWDHLVSAHPASNSFHGGSWARVLSRTYGHEPFYLHFSPSGEIGALVPLMEVSSLITGRRGICLPFSDVCPPLGFSRTISQNFFPCIVRLARERRWKCIEIRGVSPSEKAKPSATFYGHVLDLRSDAEELRKAFSSAARGAVGRAQTSGLQFRIDRTIEGMSEFYRLHARTRRRHGLPPQAFSFFRNIHSEMIESGNGFVAIAGYGSVSAAAAVFFRVGKTALYKFAASDERLQEFRGNNLIIWEAIRHLIGVGVESLHFGRTAISNPGLRRFKLACGAQEELIQYYKFDLTTDSWKTGRELTRGFYNSIFRNLPTGLSRLAGALIYPHLD